MRDMFFEASEENLRPSFESEKRTEGDEIFHVDAAIVKAFCYAGFLGGRDVAEEYFDAGGRLC